MSTIESDGWRTGTHAHASPSICGPPLSLVLHSSTHASTGPIEKLTKFEQTFSWLAVEAGIMPPKEEKPQVVACFAPGKGQLGSDGMGFMEAYAELSESIIDVDSGEKMEAYLDKKQLVNGVQRLRRRAIVLKMRRRTCYRTCHPAHAAARPRRCCCLLPMLSMMTRLCSSLTPAQCPFILCRGPSHAADIKHGKLRPLTIEHIPYVFAADKKK